MARDRRRRKLITTTAIPTNGDSYDKGYEAAFGKKPVLVYTAEEDKKKRIGGTR